MRDHFVCKNSDMQEIPIPGNFADWVLKKNPNAEITKEPNGMSIFILDERGVNHCSVSPGDKVIFNSNSFLVE